MLLIDKTLLFILNQNLSASSFAKNREFNIIDENPQDSTESEQQFTADWNNSEFIPTDPHLLISPDTSRSGLMQLVTTSFKTIDIEVEEMTDPAFIDALLQKAKTVRIRVILPELSKISANKDAVAKLQKGGVFVRTKHTPYIHAKLMILDENQAYIGSINFSPGSLDQNREMGIVISQPDILSTLEKDFITDWESG